MNSTQEDRTVELLNTVGLVSVPQVHIHSVLGSIKKASQQKLTSDSLTPRGQMGISGWTDRYLSRTLSIKVSNGKHCVSLVWS